MLEKFTVAFAVRIDSVERLRNLLANIRYLLFYENINIDVIESGDKPHFYSENVRIRYRFVKDLRSLFHRTYYMNALLLNSRDRVVGLWDADIIVPIKQIYSAVRLVRGGNTMVFPYNGEMRFLSIEDSWSFYRNLRTEWSCNTGFRMMKRPSVGGAFFVDRDRYWEIGGENENFIGWGYEDVERVKRGEIMGIGITRTDGRAFHLEHPVVGRDSEVTNYNRSLFIAVCSGATLLAHQINNMSGGFEYMKKWKRVLEVPTERF